MSDRDQLPTMKRRQQARQEGRVVASQQVTAALVWLCVATVACCWLPARIPILAKMLFTHAWRPAGVEGNVGMLQSELIRLGQFLIPVLLLVLSITVLGRLAQVGFLWVPQRLARGQQWSPAQRAAQLIDGKQGFGLLRGLVLVAWMLGVAGAGVWQQREALVQLAWVSTPYLLLTRQLATWALKLGAGLAIFALIDYMYQRQQFEDSLSMSLEEVRAEVKAVQGNPQVASERRQRMHSRHGG